MNPLLGGARTINRQRRLAHRLPLTDVQVVSEQVRRVGFMNGSKQALLLPADPHFAEALRYWAGVCSEGGLHLSILPSPEAAKDWLLRPDHTA